MNIEPNELEIMALSKERKKLVWKVHYKKNTKKNKMKRERKKSFQLIKPGIVK